MVAKIVIMQLRSQSYYILASLLKIPALRNWAIYLLLHWTFLIYLCSQLNLNISDGKGQFPEFIMSL